MPYSTLYFCCFQFASYSLTLTWGKVTPIYFIFLERVLSRQDEMAKVCKGNIEMFKSKMVIFSILQLRKVTQIDMKYEKPKIGYNVIAF